jgi:hypothetical protein
MSVWLPRLDETVIAVSEKTVTAMFVSCYVAVVMMCWLQIEL